MFSNLGTILGISVATQMGISVATLSYLLTVSLRRLEGNPKGNPKRNPKGNQKGRSLKSMGCGGGESTFEN